MHSPRRNLAIAGMITTLLYAFPMHVQAAPELSASAEAAPKGQRSDYRQGKQAALSGDAEAAVQAWAKVLAATPESVKTRRFRMQLIVDTIKVALEGHAAAPSPALLEHTLDIYYAYFTAYEKQYGNPHIPKQVVDARFELKAALDETEGTQPSPEPVAEETAPVEPPHAPPAGSEEPPPPSRARLEVSTAAAGNPDGTGLVIGGGVALVAAAAASSLIAVGAINGNNARADAKDPAYSDDQLRRINGERKKANTLFIVGVATTPVLLVAGGVLVGLGAKRMTAARRGYAVSPALGPTFAGLQLRGRF